HGAEVWDKHRLPTQIHLPALGQCWNLSHQAETTPRSQLRAIPSENHLIYTGTPAEVWPLLQRWFISMAKTHVLPELHRLAMLHADPLAGSGARWNHTRWGSCSRAGRINLSARLLWLEPAEVNYVIHHELNHLHHFDHSLVFWQALETRLPGAKLLDRGLRHASRRASFPVWLALI
ncbi:MAG TPA: M48 family peptidase, partial [bacterium]|nr:M48 family peptidase [bacterium]